MASPDGEIPEQAVTTDQVYEMQYYTQEGIAAAKNADFRNAAELARDKFYNTTLGGFVSAIAAIVGGINQFIADLLLGIKGVTGGLIDLTGYFNDEAALLRTKPGVHEIPIHSPLWQTMSRDEEPTFPRANLNFGSAPGTASGGGSGNAHTHDLSRVPDYQPAGNGNDCLEIGFIRIAKDATVDGVGLITGDSATFLGIQSAYVALFKQDPGTGNLTNVDTAFSAIDRKSSLTSKLTESVFTLTTPIQVYQDEVYGVGVLQNTTLLQTPGALVRTSLVRMNRSGAGLYPRLPYCYVGPGLDTVPATIAESSLRYDESNKLPFYYLRRVPEAA